YLLYTFYLQSYGHHPYLHSFPTRRSSDLLVAPIALYPDPLLAQTLAASTYPLELIQLQQWLLKNPGLNDQALADAVAKQPWDPRSEEHTSELQSRFDLVCRLLLEKKKKKT